MCRTREEIIKEEPTLQDLCLFIEQQEKRLVEGKNGRIHFELAQARAALDTRIAQIQDSEDINEKLDLAQEKSVEMMKKVVTRFDENEKNLGKLEGVVEAHIKECDETPHLRAAIARKPLKTLTWLFGIIVTTYTVLFFLSHILLYGTGFDAMLQTFIENLFGL